MNPYIYPVTCSVCGGEGMLHAEDVGQDWLGSVRHRDPEVCAQNLRKVSINLLNKIKKELDQQSKEGE